MLGIARGEFIEFPSFIEDRELKVAGLFVPLEDLRRLVFGVNLVVEEDLTGFARDKEGWIFCELVGLEGVLDRLTSGFN